MTARALVTVVTVWSVAFVCGGASAGSVQAPAAGPYGQALAALQAGRSDQARALLREALKLARGVGDGVVIAGTLARLDAGQGRYGEAKAFLAAQADRTNAGGYRVELARLILECDPEGANEAATLLKGVVKREPASVDAWIEYGRALARAGRLNESELAYQNVTGSLAPGDLRARHGLTETLILKRQFPRAVANALATLPLDPEAPESYCWLGRAHDRDRSKPGSYSSANEQYESAFSLDRARTLYLGHILFNLIMSDNHSVARSYARRLDKYADDSVKLWFDGLLKELDGNVGAAVALHERAVARDPRNVYARFALANVRLGKPTPGFGPFKGARRESWRYAPLRDLGRAQAEITAIRLLDPTFPFLASLSSSATRELSGNGGSAATLDEKGVESMKKLAGYCKHLRLVR